MPRSTAPAAAGSPNIAKPTPDRKRFPRSMVAHQEWRRLRRRNGWWERRAEATHHPPFDFGEQLLVGHHAFPLGGRSTTGHDESSDGKKKPLEGGLPREAERAVTVDSYLSFFATASISIWMSTSLPTTTPPESSTRLHFTP